MVYLKVISLQLIRPAINFDQQKCSVRPNLHMQDNHLLQSNMIKPYRKCLPCSQTSHLMIMIILEGHQLLHP